MLSYAHPPEAVDHWGRVREPDPNGGAPLPTMTATAFLPKTSNAGHRCPPRLSASLPAHAVLTAREDLLPYECDGLSAYRQTPLVAALPGTVAEAAEVLRIARETGTPVVARGSGTGLVGRRPAARRRHPAVARQVQPHPLRRSARPRGARAAGGAQRPDHRGRSAAGPLLRAGSLQPDRLLDRRQRRGELRRRALPQVRPHGAQHPEGTRTHDRGRRDRARLRCPRCARLRPPRGDDRLRGTARAAHRGHGEAAPEAAGCPGGDGLVQQRRGCRGSGCGRDRRRHRARRPGDDGQDGHRRGGRLRPRRLRPRGAGDPAVRIRRNSRRGRRGDRQDHGSHAQGWQHRVRGVEERGGEAAVLVRTQGGLPGGGPHLAGLLLHRRFHPARGTREGPAPHRGASSTTGCAVPTSFTPATATCIR